MILTVKKGIKSFNYNPFMTGEVNFTQFCKELCNHCKISYSQDMEEKLNFANLMKFILKQYEQKSATHIFILILSLFALKKLSFSFLLKSKSAKLD